jgi:integrase
MKTHEARTVDLTPDLTATLKRRLTWLRAEALRNGSGEPEWLFPRADGTLMNKDYAAGVFRRILKRAGLPHHPGVRPPPITDVSAQLGHSSPATRSTGNREQTSRPWGSRWNQKVEPAEGARDGTGESA